MKLKDWMHNKPIAAGNAQSASKVRYKNTIIYIL